VDGDVVIEWHRGGVDLEVKVGPRGPVHYYLESPEGREVEAVLPEDDDLRGLVSAVRQCA
jgi:hypothetical protein